MSLNSTISYSLEEIGNESLYPLIELMSELGWDPIDTEEHKRLLTDVESIFKYLYNNENNIGGNKHTHNPHQIVHEKLYKALKFALNDPPGMNCFEDLLIRSDDKRQATHFTDRLKALLFQHPEGLKKTLELYTELYHICDEHKHTLVTSQSLSEQDISLPKTEELKKAEEAIERCQAYAFDDEFSNALQFRQYIADKKYREMLDKDLLKSSSQREALAQRIIDRAKMQLTESIIKGLKEYVAPLSYTQDIISQYQIMINLIQKLIMECENPESVKEILNKLAQIPLVRENEQLRAYLGERLTVRTEIYQNPANILKCYDEDEKHTLTFFKPELIKQAQEKLHLELLTNIKDDISQRIYKNDGLIETYLPVSMKGASSNNNDRNQLLSNENGFDLNKLYHLDKGKDCLSLIMNSILKEHTLHTNQEEQNFTYDDFFTCDENQSNITGFTDKFNQIFFANDDNLHQLLIYIKMIEKMGVSEDILKIFSTSQPNSLQGRIAMLCKDYYDSDKGEALYAKISSAAQQGVDFQLLFEFSSDNKTITSINDNLWKILPTPEAQLKLFINLLLKDRPETYYDLEKSVYQYQKIKTKQTMCYQSLHHEFTLFKEKNLFRNGVETRQHLPSSGEYKDLQVGDTHGSNISLTQIGDIAVVYANGNDPNGESDYAWVMLHAPQKGINCSNYMENRHDRLPAQEFSTGVLKAKEFLGAVRIRKLKSTENGYDNNHNSTGFKIIDGFVNEALLSQFSNTPPNQIIQQVKLYGLEGPAAEYLSRAILFAKAEKEGGEAKELLEAMEQNGYLNFKASLLATQSDRKRTSYQDKFDPYNTRRKTLETEEKTIDNTKVRLFQPESLREYHLRQQEDIIKSTQENTNLSKPKKSRLKQEKKERQEEINPGKQISDFTGFSNLHLEHPTREYTNKFYDPSNLENITHLKPFPPNTGISEYLNFINNVLTMDDFLYGSDIKHLKEKIDYAVNALYALDDNAAENLARIIKDQYELKRLPVFQGPLTCAVIDAILKRDGNFINSKHFTEDIKFAINIRHRDNTGLGYFFNKSVNDEFLPNLEWTFEFIDTTNIMTVMLSPGHSLHQYPWRLYQRSNDQNHSRQLDNWQSIAKKPYEISAQGLNQLFEELSQGENLPHTSMGIGLLGKMRDYPILAGGGLDRSGNPIPGHILTDRSVCTKYFRINEEQLEQLKSNEFLSVIDSHPCVESGKYGANHVVRYRYIDLRDCERLSGKYNIDQNLVANIKKILDKEVPPELVKALWPDSATPLKFSELNEHQFMEITAGHREYQELIKIYSENLENDKAYPIKGEREDVTQIREAYLTKYKALDSEITNNSEFVEVLKSINDYNQLTLYSLVESVANDRSITPIERYQKLVSIHCFPDMNGRAMRMFYRHEANKPLYMTNWDLDITMPSKQTSEVDSIFEFSEREFTKYVNMIGALHEECEKAMQRDEPSQYYTVPKFWMASFEINPQDYTKEELQEFMKNFKSFYMQPEVQRAVEKKAYYDYMHLIMQHIYSWDKFKLQSHSDIKKNSPLHFACQNKYSNECLKNLLLQADRQGINILDLKNIYKQNAAHVAACYINIPALTTLYKHAPVLFTQTDDYGKTPYNNLFDKLYSQIENQKCLSQKTLEEFIEFGLSLDRQKYDVSKYRFNNEETLAHLLARHGDLDALLLLLQKMPKFASKKDANGKTPLEIAHGLTVQLEDQKSNDLSDISQENEVIIIPTKHQANLLILYPKHLKESKKKNTNPEETTLLSNNPHNKKNY